jgi:hypothetical protein
VKGGKWFSLIDKVFAERTLYHAARHVTADAAKASGIDRVTPKHFTEDLMAHVHRLSENCARKPTAESGPTLLDTKPGSREKRPLGTDGP